MLLEFSDLVQVGVEYGIAGMALELSCASLKSDFQGKGILIL